MKKREERKKGKEERRKGERERAVTSVTNNTSIVFCATTVPTPPKCGLAANSRNNEIAAGLLPSKRVLSRRRRWNVEFDLSENLTVRWTSQQNDLLLNKEDNTETLFSLWIRWKMTHKRLRTEVVKSKRSKPCHRRRAETRNKRKTKDTGTDWLCKAPRNAAGHLSDAASRSAAQGIQQKI